MRKKRDALFDRDVLTELQLSGVRAGGEPLQTTANARRELARVAETKTARRGFGTEWRQQCARGAIEIDDDHRPFSLALLRVRKELARPLTEPAIGELDLTHAHRAGIRER